MSWWMVFALILLGFEMGRIVEWRKAAKESREDFDRRMKAMRSPPPSSPTNTEPSAPPTPTPDSHEP